MWFGLWAVLSISILLIKSDVHAKFAIEPEEFDQQVKAGTTEDRLSNYLFV